jgi:hypothetical protein
MRLSKHVRTGSSGTIKELTVWPAEAVDGSDEAVVELGRPPQPWHLGPVVPPRRRTVPPAAGATAHYRPPLRRQPFGNLSFLALAQRLCLRSDGLFHGGGYGLAGSLSISLGAYPTVWSSTRLHGAAALAAW